MSKNNRNDDKKYVRGRADYRLNQKVQKFADRRTKRDRARETRRQNAIREQLDND